MRSRSGLKSCHATKTSSSTEPDQTKLLAPVRRAYSCEKAFPTSTLCEVVSRPGSGRVYRSRKGRQAQDDRVNLFSVELLTSFRTIQLLSTSARPDQERHVDDDARPLHGHLTSSQSGLHLAYRLQLTRCPCVLPGDQIHRAMRPLIAAPRFVRFRGRPPADSPDGAGSRSSAHLQ